MKTIMILVLSSLALVGCATSHNKYDMVGAGNTEAGETPAFGHIMPENDALDKGLGR